MLVTASLLLTLLPLLCSMLSDQGLSSTEPAMSSSASAAMPIDIIEREQLDIHDRIIKLCRPVIVECVSAFNVCAIIDGIIYIFQRYAAAWIELDTIWDGMIGCFELNLYHICMSLCLCARSHLRCLLPDLRLHLHIIQLLAHLLPIESRRREFRTLRMLSSAQSLNTLRWIVSHLPQEETTTLHSIVRLFKPMQGMLGMTHAEVEEVKFMQVKVRPAQGI
jgi:hypothetical protein